MKPKILIIRFSSLGDIVLTSSAVLNVKINFPDSHIVFLCKEKFTDIVKMINGVDEIVTISDKISAAKYVKKLIELDKYEFDYIIDLQGNLRSWWARKILSADKSVVYPKRRMERVLAVKNKVIPASYPHTIDLYNFALKDAGLNIFSKRPLLIILKSLSDDKIIEFFEKNEKYIVIAPGAAHPVKQWPVERFVETANLLYRRENIGIVWAVTEADKNDELIKSKIPSSSLLSLTDYPVGKLAEIISGAQLTIANDSGISHISSAVGTSVISLFGPTHPVLGFSPKGLFDQIMQVDEPCRPCSLHGKKECYREERFCFTRISSETVVNNAVNLLKSNTEKNKAVFVDRDGTIIVDKHFLSNPDEIEFEERAVEGIRKIQEQGYKIVIISNQSGVARGYFNTETVDVVNARLIEKLAAKHILVDAVYFCPHYPNGTKHPYNIECNCRKPAGGMAEDAAYQLGINLRKSIVIGDKIDDVNLAGVIGAGAVLVKTGYGQKSLEIIKSCRYYDDIGIADNLDTASRLIEDFN